MFPSSNSPRRQSVTYPSYQQSGVGGYDYTGGHGVGGMYPDQQWPAGYHHIYSRYDEWNHHHAAAAAVAAQFQQPPSPAGGAAGGPAPGDNDSATTAGLLYGGYSKPGVLCPPVGDFKPPILGDFRSLPGQDDQPAGEAGEADPLRSQSVAGVGGRAHHSPDSGLAASDGVSGSDSPNHVHHHQPPSPSLHHDISLPSRPQPARSPYEWMKRPSIAARPCKEGSDGRTRTKDKYRVVYSDHQRLELEKEFHYSRYITIRRKAELAQALSLSERQVKIWFQNRRAKERKQVKKRDELMTKDKIDVSGLSVHPSHMAAMSGFALGPMSHMMHHHPQHLPHL